MKISRRTVLGGAAVSLLPPSLHEAIATPMRHGGLAAVEHVIVLMQENRSFDHYYGTLRGVRGFGDRHPLTLPSGKPVFAQPGPAGGDVLPFSLREAAATAGRNPDDIQYLDALPHGFGDATQAWSKGWWNDWIRAKTPATMTYYDRTDIPLQYELADTFTILDAYHCSVFGSTNPNRNYLVSGTTGYEPGTTRRAVTNAAYSYDHPGYEWTTYAERLEAAGVSWQVYQEWDNFTDNAIEYFVPFKRIGTKILSAVTPRFRTTEEFYYALFEHPERDRLLGEFAKGVAALTPAERRLFERGMARSEPESLVDRVRSDISAGTLPQVSWLVPSAVDSEHPSSSTPVGSANLIYDLLDAIASDRDTWSKSVLLINFDENDGYFDHVPPPVAPRPVSGNGDDWYDGRPIGLGPRVPMTIVSPWTVGGFVSSEVADHTSVIRLLERWTGVREPNISPWRRAVCGDLLSPFDFDRAGRRPRVDAPGPVPPEITRWRPAPPADQALPDQEPGNRPARPLAYKPAVSARLDGTTLQLRLINRGRKSVHFAVYPYSAELVEPRHVDVSGETVETVPVRGTYHLAIQGPNNFWYELAGTAAGVAVDVRAAAVRQRLELVLTNPHDHPVTVELDGRTTRLRGGQTRTIPWPTDHGSYDVTVTARSDPSYRRRLTGSI